ncbi:hypothetical protein EHRUM4_03680 [Ehrlichia ruminantium]|uniref:Uncharacterized protein n=1 Tax=Ehrlichia ruminantium TaxID=779 RepID=A0A170QNG8_EHRRU|nr:hypothetical protein EHRUM4_03680 [Ehrlichia ruminantium]GAT77151.1 hypothetical protein EHRUM2_03620 [Ehrlichia ruminantium]GAT78230.1 hypothetical protein EHRUM3_04440 [Ehrlichia ruminantium]
MTDMHIVMYNMTIIGDNFVTTFAMRVTPPTITNPLNKVSIKTIVLLFTCLKVLLNRIDA